MDIRIVPKSGSLAVTGEIKPVIVVSLIKNKVVYVEFRPRLPKCLQLVANFDARGPPSPELSVAAVRMGPVFASLRARVF